MRVKLDTDKTGFGGYDGEQSQKKSKWVEMIQILVVKVVGAKYMTFWMVSLLTAGNAVRNDLVGFTWGILITDWTSDTQTIISECLLIHDYSTSCSSL